MRKKAVVLLGIVISLSCFGTVVGARDFTKEEQDIINKVQILSDKESDEVDDDFYIEMLGYYKYLDKELKRKYPSADYTITGYKSDEISDGEFSVKNNESDEVYTAIVEIPDGGSKSYIEKDCFYNSIFKDKMEEKYDELLKDVRGFIGARCVFNEETSYITEESKLSDLKWLSKDIFIYCEDTGKAVEELAEDVKEVLGDDLPGRYNVFLIKDIDTSDIDESLSQYLWFNSEITDSIRFEVGFKLKIPS